MMDYSNKDDAPKTGTTIVACCYDGGVVIAADSRVSTGTYVSNRASDKITPLADNVFLLRSGSAADTQAVCDYGASAISGACCCCCAWPSQQSHSALRFDTSSNSAQPAPPQPHPNPTHSALLCQPARHGAAAQPLGQHGGQPGPAGACVRAGGGL